jgi:hypothetical protein
MAVEHRCHHAATTTIAPTATAVSPTVTHAWQAVVAPNHVLLIGLLAVFEATVGVLILSGGRRPQLGYLAVIAFYLALTLFGWIPTVWFIIMLAPMLLLRAERRAATAPAPAARTERPRAGVGS